MKSFILLVFLFFAANSMAATCTSLSRNNYSANSVLTSSALNADFNQLVTGHNSFDGGCVTAGSLEYDALNTTQFAPLLKGVKEGCKVNYVSASSINVSECLASVNGNFVYTSGNTSLAMGCGDCDAEVASTSYYVYIKNGSTATTLNAFFSTTAPEDNGYDTSNNRVLARLYNNASGDIDQYSIDQWHNNRFIATESDWVNAGTVTINGSTSAPSKGGSVAIDKFTWKRVGPDMVAKVIYRQNSGGSAGSGAYIIPIPSAYSIDFTNVSAGPNGCTGTADGVQTNGIIGYGLLSDATVTASGNPLIYNSTSLAFSFTHASSGGCWGSSLIPLSGAEVSVSFTAIIPIKGWGN